MRIITPLFIAHIVLLALASSGFSLISWMWGSPSLQWNYFQVSYSHGRGYHYVSPYTLPQVLCYLVAYGLGVAAFGRIWKTRGLSLAALAAGLCVIGTLSFAIEATHWLWDHHLSLIASFPIVMVVLWACIAGQMGRKRATRPAQPRPAQ